MIDSGLLYFSERFFDTFEWAENFTEYLEYLFALCNVLVFVL